MRALRLRPPTTGELASLSALCLRSKGWWGYDQAFLEACRAELTLTEADIEAGSLVLCEGDEGIAGVAQLALDDDGCFLEKLFVDPPRIGQGVGRALWSWSVDEARRLGVDTLIVEADPDAVPFYSRMGCTRAGSAPSGSVPGRMLPRLVYRVPVISAP